METSPHAHLQTSAAETYLAAGKCIFSMSVMLQLKTMKTVALEKATPANCGAKAAACAELAKVAAGADFKTPAGVCLPFGTMDAAIKVLVLLLTVTPSAAFWSNDR